MHEMSIVQALVEQCEKIAEENNATKIIKVEVKIGILSGVEPHFFKTSFEAFKQRTICEDAKLVMNIQDLIVQCHKCEEQSHLKENVFLCPKCQSEDIQVIDGEDMMLMQLEME